MKSNSITLIWVSAHSRTDGNERADELANLRGALDTLDPEPSPPIAQTVIKQKIKEQTISSFEDKWFNSKKYTKT